MSSAAQTFTYTPASAGTRTITASSADGGTITGSPASLTVAAIGLTLTGPTSGITGVASTAFTVTPATASNDIVSYSATGGTFSPASPFTFTTSSATPQTFTFTPSVAGARTITVTSADGGTVTGSPWTYTATYVTAPTITATTPTANAIGVPVANPVVATFSAAIQQGSLSFVIAPTAGGSAVPGTVILDGTGTVATLVPSRPFSLGTGYTAVVNATGTNGVAMASPYSWSWTTPDVPPTGTWYIPETCFDFGGPIISAGLTITATTASGASFPGTTSYNSGTFIATFTPVSPFVAGTKYLLTISGATAPDGTAMATQTISFTPSAATSGRGWFAGLGRPTARLGS